MEKKAVAVIYSPKTLLDFIWYYSSYGKEYEWDVIVVPYGNDIEKIQPYLKKANIFKHIIIDSDTEIFQSAGKKIKLFMQMMAFFLVKKRKLFCKKYIEERINIDEYSLVVIPNIFKTLPCMFVDVSDEYRTVILEDGTIDYKDLRSRLNIHNVNNYYDIVGFFLSKMGYGCHSDYGMKNTKFCEKFASKPERMKYRNFKKILKLNDMKTCDKDLYRQLLNRIYPIPNGIENVDAVICTYPYIDYVNDDSFVTTKIVNYINKNFKDRVVILKKHPRDTADYNFDSSVKVIIVDQTVPAEIFLTYFKVRNFIFAWPSTVLFSIDDSKSIIKILYFKSLVAANKKYKHAFVDAVRALDVKEKDIVKI